jgi:hypothetical protein
VNHDATRYRLLALDVDGTLLDRDGRIRPDTITAVAQAREAGLLPILCTGRRYRRARPIALELGLDIPIVCNSGALVKDPRDHRTLWRADLDVSVVAQVLTVFQERDEPAVSFTDNDPSGPDFLVEAHPTGRPLFDEYCALNAEHVGMAPGWSRRPAETSHFHLCAIGSRGDMLDFERSLLDRFAPHIRTFVQKSPRYSGTMCEVIRRDASKWSAVLRVAAAYGIAPATIVAVGDDMNDLPMIEGAGLGVAMAHAPEAVRNAANLIIGDQDSAALAGLIENVLAMNESRDAARPPREHAGAPPRPSRREG